MRHSTPPPLKMAIDLVKKFNVDLVPRLTPEQRRDFARLQTLLEEVDRAVTHVPTAAHRPAPALHGHTQTQTHAPRAVRGY